MPRGRKKRVVDNEDDIKRSKRKLIPSINKKGKEEKESDSDGSDENSMEDETEDIEEVEIVVDDWNKDAINLEELGYKYNTKGKLVQIDNDKPFKFIDQSHYNLVGDFVIEHIYKIMKSKPYNLEEVWLPISTESTNKKPNTDAQVNIFMTKDALTNPNKLMVLSHGMGAVRAGIWSRSLCINDSLTTGSMLPYIEKAIEQGYGLILYNYNVTSVVMETKNNKKEVVPIDGLSSSFQHVHYVFDNFISKAKAKDIFIVAHSFGGTLSTQLFVDREQQIFGENKDPIKIRAVALTDSVHSYNRHWSKRVKTFIGKHCINFACGNLPLNKKMKRTGGCVVVSAGTEQHEMSSSSCIEPLFQFLSKYNDK